MLLLENSRTIKAPCDKVLTSTRLIWSSTFYLLAYSNFPLKVEQDIQKTCFLVLKSIATYKLIQDKLIQKSNSLHQNVNGLPKTKVNAHFICQ